MRITRWIIKAKHTHKYVIIIALPTQQLLQKRASKVRYTYTAGLLMSALDAEHWSASRPNQHKPGKAAPVLTE